MKQEKFLFYFRFQFPVDWVNTSDHEFEGFVFINTNSNEEAIKWGNIIAEKFIDELFAKGNYQKKIAFTSFIWAGPNYEFSDLEKEEAKNFPVVKQGEFPVWNFESKL